jgi:hypothetical protein
MNTKNALRCTTAVSIALLFSTACLADDSDFVHRRRLTGSGWRSADRQAEGWRLVGNGKWRWGRGGWGPVGAVVGAGVEATWVRRDRCQWRPPIIHVACDGQYSTTSASGAERQGLRRRRRRRSVGTENAERRSRFRRMGWRKPVPSTTHAERIGCQGLTERQAATALTHNSTNYLGRPWGGRFSNASS